MAEQLKLTEAGEMVERWWRELPNKFPQIVADVYVVMPNHIHGIVTIQGTVGADLCVRPSMEDVRPPQTKAAREEEAAREDISLTAVMQWFKTMTTSEYIQGVRQTGWPPFDGKVWQRSFHDHIIQGQEEWDHICRYIVRNPVHWAEDEENPLNTLQGGPIYVPAPNYVPAFNGVGIRL